MENEKLPSWANCWAKNKLTGEVVPAYYNDQTWELHDEQGNILGNEWSNVITKSEKIGLAIIFGLAFVGVLFAAFLYFGARA